MLHAGPNTDLKWAEKGVSCLPIGLQLACKHPDPQGTAEAVTRNNYAQLLETGANIRRLNLSPVYTPIVASIMLSIHNVKR